MDRISAEKIGSRQAIKAVTIGLITAQLLMTMMVDDTSLLNGFLWFTEDDYALNVVVGAICFYVCGYLFGQRAGYEIIIKQRNHLLIGFICGFISLVTATFLAGWLGFFQEGAGKYHGFSDYIITPVVVVSVVGILPCLLVGFWLGYQIKKRGDQEQQ